MGVEIIYSVVKVQIDPHISDISSTLQSPFEKIYGAVLESA